MSLQTETTLSYKRIFISVLLLVMIPVSATLVNRFVDQYDISLMFSFNMIASVMIMYDWSLLSTHFERSRKNIVDTFLFIFIGFMLITGWLYLGINYLKIYPVIPDTSVLVAYGYARPGMLIAYSVMSAASFGICFKCITDRINVHNKEFQTILLSGLLYGLVYTLIFTPWQPFLLARAYLFYTILTILFAYLYNQTHTIIPGIISLSIVYLLIMIMPLL